MRSIAASSLVVLALILPGIASAKPSVTLKLTGAVVTKAADGHTTLTPVEKTQPKSGDEIQYDIVANNAGDSPALRLVPVGKIPAGTSYVDGSARAVRAHAEFSLDGGKTWSAAPTVTVKRPDGTTVVKKADPATYTAVRFVTDGALAAHGSLGYSYEVRVK
ncbi:MAG: DUF11 domain-containing protein [Candidatus Eremiobacteraeota bacterium]|nr:DUF11 domain-containing protein [Candidatus Eremiobacteraeota bacterium]MBV8644891.1 DUF11 domain-containing protein [Candidatus Eremiobacteraeota bacterium]